jgi:hypothetical protein
MLRRSTVLVGEVAELDKDETGLQESRIAVEPVLPSSHPFIRIVIPLQVTRETPQTFP